MKSVLLLAFALLCAGTFQDTSLEDKTVLLQVANTVKHRSMGQSSGGGAIWLKFGAFQFSDAKAFFQEPIEWCKTDPSAIIFSGVIGGYLFLNGVVLLWAVLHDRKLAQALLESDTVVTDAKILETHVKSGSEDKTYHCSYEFTAERNDGTMCRVEVKDRSVPYVSYKMLKKDEVMPVHYSPEDPSRCRLTCVAEVESFLCRAGNCMTLFTAICFIVGGLWCIVGIYCAFLPFGIPSWFLGMFISYAVFWYFGAFEGVKDATVTELHPPGATYGSVS